MQLLTQPLCIENTTVLGLLVSISYPGHISHAHVFTCAPEISTVKSPPESVEAETEKDNQLQQTCDNSAHIQELHNSKVTLKGEAIKAKQTVSCDLFVDY